MTTHVHIYAVVQVLIPVGGKKIRDVNDVGQRRRRKKKHKDISGRKLLPTKTVKL